MEQPLEPFELAAVGEDARGDVRPVDAAVAVEDAVAPSAPRTASSTSGSPASSSWTDLVARGDSRTVPRERLQGLALARADAACDGDRDRSRHGLLLLLGVRYGGAVAGLRSLGRRLLLELHLRGRVRLGRGLVRRLDLGGLRNRCRPVAEDLLGQVEPRRSVDGLAAVGARLNLAFPPRRASARARAGAARRRPRG